MTWVNLQDRRNTQIRQDNRQIQRQTRKAICYVSSFFKKKRPEKQRSRSPRLSCWSCFSNFHIFLATDIPSKTKVSEVSIYMSESVVDSMFGILKTRPCMKIYDPAFVNVHISGRESFFAAATFPCMNLPAVSSSWIPGFCNHGPTTELFECPFKKRPVVTQGSFCKAIKNVILLTCVFFS